MTSSTAPECRPFSSLLIANRGEIACRIIRTAKSLGLHTIAVFSQADREALHVRMADDAVEIGPAAAAQSYLSIDAIIEAARVSGAEAIHPGYGFLSENAAFARACAEAGLIFVGPGPEAIEIMGDKARAKRKMIAAGVPCVPGYQGENQSVEALKREAHEIGFPIMVKAAAGGGGRGMRLVEAPEGLEDALAEARSEAESAFGAGDLILERAIIEPRHVEIQVFADAHGTIVHLGERDCSVQRRHQKIIEEAPSPAVDNKLREKMGATAVEAARAVNYRGAGTVEFLLAKDGSFYFLEMNTRLQVEHPVTEMVTGLDLVAMQLAVAAGEPLAITQDDVELNGHAIEVRLYSEDPQKGFLPSSGKALVWREPTAPGFRVDSGIAQGDGISPHYDPMVAKIIAFGADRNAARRKLLKALRQTVLLGPETNRDFLIDCLQQRSFADAEASTAFIAQTYGETGFSVVRADAGVWADAAALFYVLQRQEALLQTGASVDAELIGWSSTGTLRSVLVLSDGDATRRIGVSSIDAGSLTIRDGEHISERSLLSLTQSTASFAVEQGRAHLTYARDGANRLLFDNGTRVFAFEDKTHHNEAKFAEGDGSVTAPMHGAIASVSVRPGDAVKSGDRLLVLEAMKMQHQIIAPMDGTVENLGVAAGQQVSSGQVLIEIRPLEG